MKCVRKIIEVMTNMYAKIVSFLQSPLLRQPRTTCLAWLLTGVVFALVKFGIGKFNNYKIFEWVYWHAREGLTLYGDYPGQYYDSNHYGIIFSFIIAPFAWMPQWLGLVLWVVANTALLYYAIRQLPLTALQKAFIYWYAYIELMTAQGVQQFNISVAAFIILAYAFIHQRKDFWAALVIVLGTFIKIYPIVGLAFFFFSKRKGVLIAGCFFWAAVCFFLPVLYTPGLEYVCSQYVDWFERLQLKNALNMFAPSQNISLLGLVRKWSGNPDYSDLWLIVPALVLFFIPYFRFSQYKHLRFQLMLLAHVLLFVVLFSTGSEASGYITVMIGVALWYLCSPSEHQTYHKWLLIVTLVIVAVSSTELVPKFIRNGFIQPYVFKVWPLVVVWLTLCYEMIRLDFAEKPAKGRAATSL